MRYAKNLTLALALRVIGVPVAYDNEGGKWKKKDDGSLEVDSNGNPIYIDSKGNELALGTDTVGRLNGEAKNNRERAELAEGKLKAFEGLDATAARNAIETVGKIDQKTLIDAGEVDKVRDEIKKVYDTQLAERDEANGKLQGQLTGLRRQTAFNSSKFIQDKIAVPVDMIEATFGNNFKDEDGKLTAYYPDGSKVMSRKNAGEAAGFDEALEIFVDRYPHRDNILKGGGHNGSGNGGGGGGQGGVRTVRRSEFDKMAPADQAKTAADQREGKAKVVAD